MHNATSPRIREGMTAASVILLAALGAAGCSGDNGGADSNRTGSSKPQEETVLIWNVSDHNMQNVAKNVTSLAADTDADVIVLQEFYSSAWRRQLRKHLLCDDCPYASTITDFKHDGPGKDQNPVAWKKADYKAVKIKKVTIHPNPSATGKAPLDPKEITEVTLEDKTGKRKTIMDVHPIAYAEADGLPTNKADNVDYYGVFMDALVAEIDTARQESPDVPVIPAGDFNVGDMADTAMHYPVFPAERLGREGMSSNFELLAYKGLAKDTKTRTKDPGIVDKLYVETSAPIKVVSTQIGQGTRGSDHHWVTVGLTRS